MREPTDGELVTSMLNPSHKLIPGREQERIASATGGSRMANYAELMTVQQRIDLVAFLHSSYSTKDEAARLTSRHRDSEVPFAAAIPLRTSGSRRGRISSP